MHGAWGAQKLRGFYHNGRNPVGRQISAEVNVGKIERTREEEKRFFWGTLSQIVEIRRLRSSTAGRHPDYAIFGVNKCNGDFSTIVKETGDLFHNDSPL
jgi:hypothetical protein